MKRFIFSLVVVLTAIFLTACDETTPSVPDKDQEVEIKETVNNYNVLGILSYVSTSFLDEVISEDVTLNRGLIQLNSFALDTLVKPETITELDLEQVNIYIDKLNTFIDHGTEGFGDVSQVLSDRAEYEFMIRIIIGDDVYVLYYNIDVDTNEISGIFIYDDYEYTIVAENAMLKTNDIDELSDEEKQSLTLIAMNGTNSIAIEYEIKSEDGESKETLSLITNIEGIGNEFLMEIKTEEEKLVLTISNGEDEYKFKTDGEDDFDYKLDYIVNGVKGKVRIQVTTNDDGELVYFYRVQERSVKFDIELEDPDNDD